MELYTIGHSNHTPEKFGRLLEDNLIDFVVDVRSTPYSQWAPFANRENLERLLSSINIRYLYLGDLLGGHIPGLENAKKTEKIKAYDVVREEKYFNQGLSKLLEVIERCRVCILCAEEDPSSCHRRLLVGVSLLSQGIQILHIRGDGHIQLEEELWKEEHHINQSQISLPM